jgi:hypothetical protein
MYMLTKLLVLMLLSSAAMLGQACNATADQCKDPVTHPIHDSQRHCTCFTCQTGTPDEKVLCASDPKEEGRLQARAEKTRKDFGGGSLTPRGDISLPPLNTAAGESDARDSIQSAINSDPALSRTNITVDVKHGKQVELNGTVPNKDAKDAAERIAIDNADGLKVKNHLKISPSDSNAPPSPKQ